MRNIFVFGAMGVCSFFAQITPTSFENITATSALIGLCWYQAVCHRKALEKLNQEASSVRWEVKALREEMSKSGHANEESVALKSDPKIDATPTKIF